jgi:hypothetical protein
VVQRLVGYGRFDDVETARVMARLYAAARLHANYFQPSFKLKGEPPLGFRLDDFVDVADLDGDPNEIIIEPYRKSNAE